MNTMCGCVAYTWLHMSSCVAYVRSSTSDRCVYSYRILAGYTLPSLGLAQRQSVYADTVSSYLLRGRY